MAWPPSLADFYTPRGLAPAACVPDARQVKGVTISGTVFELPGHGLQTGDAIYFAAGSTTSALPTGLSAQTTYRAVRLNGHFFSITDANGGAVTITSQGSGVINVLEDMEPKILIALDDARSLVEGKAKAYKPPWTSAPPWAVRIACNIAAFEVSTFLRVASPRFDPADLRKRYDNALEELDRLNAGQPMAEEPVDQTPTVAEEGPKPVSLLAPGAFDLTNGAGDDIA